MYKDLLDKVKKENLNDAQYLEKFVIPLLGVSSNEFDFQQSIIHKAYMGKGLEIWQSPQQFAQYLHHVINLPIDCYVEYGVYRGGTFIATRELFNKYNDTNLEAHCVDIVKHGEMIGDYCQAENAHYYIWDESEVRQKTVKLLSELSEKYHNILILIDGNHDYDYVSKDYDAFAPYVKYVAMHDITNGAVPGVGQKWQEIKKKASHDFVYEFIYQYPEFQKEPYFGMGLLSQRTNDVQLLALSHDQAILDRVPILNRITKVNLNELELEEFQDNQLAEFRVYMSLDDEKLSEHEYWGFISGRWNEKYPNKQNRLETLHSLNMSPNVVWCSHIDKSKWDSWLKQFDGEELFNDLEEFNHMTRQHNKPFIWSGNFICHQKIAKEITAFIQANVEYIYESFEFNIPFVHPDPDERKRNFGFLLESLLMLYLTNRPGLALIEIP